MDTADKNPGTGFANRKRRRRAAMPRIRTCANCGHFSVLDEGYEIGRIEDTRFMVSHCDALGWRVKEHYLFTGSTQTVLEIKPEKPCAHWADAFAKKRRESEHR